MKAPLEEFKAVQAAETTDQADFLGRGAAKALEERQRRELTAREEKCLVGAMRERGGER